MIKAVFSKGDRGFVRAEISGHAGYAVCGNDIVCASVSSAVQMAANGITEIVGAPAEVIVDEDSVVIELPAREGDPAGDSAAEHFLAALCLHIELLMQEYEQNIKLTVLEV